MIKGIGIDIIELERIESSMKSNSRFVKRILTEKELKRYNELPSPRRKVEYVAGRFAAKEACAKALGTGIGKLSFQDIEILHMETGAPYLRVSGYNSEHLFLSISHSKEYAVAQVVIEE